MSGRRRLFFGKGGALLVYKTHTLFIILHFEIIFHFCIFALSIKPHKTMIKNLILDFGKVLVDYDFNAFFRNYIPDTQRCEAVIGIINNPTVQNAMDYENVPVAEFIDSLVSANPEYEAEIRYFDEHYPEIVTSEMAGMSDLLKCYKDAGYKLYGLSNWCSKVYKTMAQFPIFKLLDGYVVSSEEHHIKPNPEIYNILFQRFGLIPGECVFADDKAENILAGEKLGMPGIVFTTALDYAEKLESIIKKSL